MRTKENINKIYDLAWDMQAELKEIVDKRPDKFLDLQNRDGERDSIYGLAYDFQGFGESIHEVQVLGLAIMEGHLWAYIEENLPLGGYTKQEMLDGDGWMTLDPCSGIIFVHTILSIMEVIEEYLPTD